MGNTWILLRSAGGRRRRRGPRPFPACSSVLYAALFDAAEIASHIQAVHGPQHIYLRVNGRIIRDIGWAERGISELRLVLLGFAHASVAVSGTGPHKPFVAAGDANLKRLIPSDFEGELTIRVDPLGGTARQFTLYSRSLPQFRRDTLDALIQSWSAEDIRPDGSPDISRWRELTGDMGVLENRYLSGFFRICPCVPP
jgi:hypothetical protein